jgi:hypothetical protein
LSTLSFIFLGTVVAARMSKKQADGKAKATKETDQAVAAAKAAAKGISGDPTSYNRPKKEKSKACFNCGDSGHLSKDCTKPKVKFVTKGKENCYKCGKPGHLSKDCTAEKIGT